MRKMSDRDGLTWKLSSAPERHKTKSVIAVETLRNAILEGQFDPGSRVDIRSLSESLGMSITPVREALRVLTAEGLLLYSEHKQISVVEVAGKEAQEVYELRVLLEGRLTRQATCNVSTEEQREALRRLQDEFTAAAAAGDIDLARKANRKWHMYVYELADAKHTLKMVERLWGLFDWGGIWTLPGRLNQSAIEHGRITEAIVNGESEVSCNLMERHVGSGKDAVEALSGRFDIGEAIE